MKHSEQSPAKHPGPAHRRVCMICGKPSAESICEPCKSKVQGENQHKHFHPGKGGKR